MTNALTFVKALMLTKLTLLQGELISVKENNTASFTCLQSSTIIREVQGQLITYVSGNTINPTLPDHDRLSIEPTTKNEIKFKIHQFSSQFAGRYKCIWSEDENQKDLTFDLRLQSDVEEDLRAFTIEGENANNFVFSAEGLSTNLICSVTGIHPNDRIGWVTGNKTLNESASGLVIYSLVPERKQHLQSFTCRIDSGQTLYLLNRSILLFLNLNPALVITVTDSTNVIENNTLELVCSFSSTTPIKRFSWRYIHQYTTTMLSVTENRLYLKNVQRNQAGIYECEVENMIGINRNFVEITVYYGPDISFNYHVTNYSQTLTCLPSGNPTNYTFYPWEHKTDCGDHVEFISGDGNGHLMLPLDMYWYQRRGLYVCSVSNGIPVNGKMVTTAEYFLNETGKPHFASANQQRYRLLGADAFIYLYYISYPPVTDVMIFSQDNGDIQNFFTQVTDSVAVSETVNGRTVRLKGSKMILSFTIDKSYNSQIYTVMLSNSFGTNNITIDLKQNSTTKKEWITVYTDIKLWIIIPSVIVLVSMVVCVCMSTDTNTWTCQYFTCSSSSSQHHNEERQERAHYDEIGSVLYTSVFDDVTHANLNEVIPMDTTTNQSVIGEDHVVQPTSDVIINDIAGLCDDWTSDVSTENSDDSYMGPCNLYDEIIHVPNRCNSFHEYEKIAQRLYSRELYRIKLSTASSIRGQHLKCSTI